MDPMGIKGPPRSQGGQPHLGRATLDEWRALVATFRNSSLVPTKCAPHILRTRIHGFQFWDIYEVGHFFVIDTLLKTK